MGISVHCRRYLDILSDNEEKIQQEPTKKKIEIREEIEELAETPTEREKSSKRAN